MKTKSILLSFLLVLLAGRFLTGCHSNSEVSSSASDQASHTQIGLVTAIYGNDLTIQKAIKNIIIPPTNPNNSSSREGSVNNRNSDREPSTSGNKTSRTEGIPTNMDNDFAANSNSDSDQKRPSSKDQPTSSRGIQSEIGDVDLYTLLDETESYTIPVGTPVTQMGSTMTFAQIAKEQYIAISFNAEDQIQSIEILGGSK